MRARWINSNTTNNQDTTQRQDKTIQDTGEDFYFPFSCFLSFIFFILCLVSPFSHRGVGSSMWWPTSDGQSFLFLFCRFLFRIMRTAHIFCIGVSSFGRWTMSGSVKRHLHLARTNIFFPFNSRVQRCADRWTRRGSVWRQLLNTHCNLFLVLWKV